MILWSVSAVIAFYFDFPVRRQSSRDAVLLDTLGAYLAIRSLIPDGEGVRFAVKTLAVVCAILGLGMINEQISHINVFGMSEGFRHRNPGFERRAFRSGATLGCLYAGAFSGVLIPLFIWLWKETKSRMRLSPSVFRRHCHGIHVFSSTSQLALWAAWWVLAYGRYARRCV